MILKPGDMLKSKNTGGILIAVVPDNSIKDGEALGPGKKLVPSKLTYLILANNKNGYADEWFVSNANLPNGRYEINESMYEYLGNISGKGLQEKLLSSFKDPKEVQ